jgi:threonine/homoserine/homoserine lactone efflux protein
MLASIAAIVLLAVSSLSGFCLVAILIVGGVILIYFGLRSWKEAPPIEN